MAVKIRLKRMGAKKKPFYRLIVADSRAPRDGRFIEELGYYNPLKEPAEINIDEEKAQYWLSQGAQPTDTVKKLFDRVGIAKPTAAKEKAQAVETEAATEATE
ncbi:MAG TPA: 30S ribosomal protein S16 [Clostridiales bacterium UBA9856]|nr:30S ribosomal protein S16 [Clostridiales bacterium UBA9856]HOA43208.1 30S ribosomal protein S16 [Bacillota bacterium]